MLTRFAPSLTGYLHAGHLWHLGWVAAKARQHSGKIILRLEDHDKQRYRTEYREDTMAVLNRIGFFDLAEFERDREVVQQSDHDALYENILRQLEKRGLLYGCDCSRRQLQERANRMPLVASQFDAANETAYDGHCRDRSLPLAGNIVRLRLPQNPLFQIEGEVQDVSRQCGDMILRDKLGQYSYHLCVVADDHRQGVTHIIRGTDLVQSTGRQMLLRNLLGYADIPQYFHHPLLLDANREKLSKRTLAEAVIGRLEGGETIGQILAEALAVSGFADWQVRINIVKNLDQLADLMAGF